MKPDQDRTEPYFNDAHIPLSANPFHGRFPSYGESGAPPARPLSRIALMAGIFAIGAVVGLAAAWWMHKPAPRHVLAAPERQGPAAVMAAPKAVPGERVTKVRGISPDELPYDGASPPVETIEPASGNGAVAVTRRAPQPDSRASVSSASAPEQDGADAAPPFLQPKNAARAAVVDVPETPPKLSTKSVAQAKASDKKVVNTTQQRRPTTQQRRPAPKAVKDKEIERIKQQAADELKKKTEHRRVLEEARIKGRQIPGQRDKRKLAVASGAGGVHTVLARCERAPNFIRREQCKWRVCSGRWGKGGCPSYQAHASSY